jgi:eukaryotic-like serine/threonine-protein kinase
MRGSSMPLQTGTRLGPYEVLSPIGAGGMGEVYRARDTRLDRSVAVKVLAPELASDPQFRARFTREAKAISAMNHPHICSLHDIGREQDVEYLVLELLEGETLAARLARGPLPLGQVLRFGTEIADALEAAHRLGIVHRDLKPANVMLTAAGTKLLDFGLAKHTVGSAGQALSALATTPGTGTAQGTLIGTLQYMAPEQVQGQPADARTDIFALGALLHEMATGRRAFAATTQASVIAKILETEPPLVSSLAPLAPPALDHLVQGCLAKAPADRWQTAHDVKMELQWIQTQGSASEQTRSGRPGQKSRVWVPWAVATVLSVALAATGLALWQRPPVAPPLPVRFDLILPPNVLLDILEFDRGAISPDGQRFVFTAMVDGRPQLVMRTLASSTLIVLPGTDHAFNPFWSPDSQSVAFFVDTPGELRRISVSGGRAQVLAKAEYRIEASGTWTTGVILFGPRDGRIYRVADTGGTASPLPLRSNPGKSFEFPRLLPDGRHFIVNVSEDPALYLASLDGPGTRKILEDALSVACAAGHLFYARGASLYARPFDPERLEFSGAEVQVVVDGAMFSVSDQGSIVYRPEHVSTSRLTWFDRNGRRTGTVGEPGPYHQLVVSQRGRRAIVVRGDIEGGGDLWEANLSTGVFSRLTTHSALDTDPSLSPDERALAFTSFRNDRAAVFVKDLVGGTESPLIRLDEHVMLDQWTPDGRFVVFRAHGNAVYAASLSGDRTPRLLADMPFTQDEVHVSPDGRWVAFDSDESGHWEVYVAAFPAFTSKRQMSNGGGVQPQWSTGGELFYLHLDGSMMSVRVETRPDVTAGAAVRLFPTASVPVPDQPQYGVTADGQRFLGLERVGQATSFTFLLNWPHAKSADASTPVQ